MRGRNDLSNAAGHILRIALLLEPVLVRRERTSRSSAAAPIATGNGHNYTLEVTVAGDVDPVTGFVVDLKWLKDVIEREVLAAWDHRHLNLDVPEFAATESAALIPTTENLAIAAWKRLDPR